MQKILNLKKGIAHDRTTRALNLNNGESKTDRGDKASRLQLLIRKGVQVNRAC